MATVTTNEKMKVAPADVKKTVELHKKAAQHHTDAAKYHKEAAKHYEVGDHGKAKVSEDKANDAHLLASKAHTNNMKPIHSK